MSSRYYNWREGDRSELLADFLLSGIGISTPVRRQDDVGFDFYCTIGDQERGILTFGFPFIIQIKSSSKPKIVSFGTDNPKEWRLDQVEWLFRSEFPIFFGFVNKKAMNIEIYDCSSFSYSRIRNKLPALVEFHARQDETDESDINKPSEIAIENWNNESSDGKKCIVDLGHPIIILSNADFEQEKIIKKKKDLLRQAVSVQATSLIFFKQGLGYLNWIVNNKTDYFIQPGWSYFTQNDSQGTINTIDRTGEALISIALHAKVNGQSNILDSVKPLIKYIDTKKIPDQIKKSYPDIFD